MTPKGPALVAAASLSIMALSCVATYQEDVLSGHADRRISVYSDTLIPQAEAAYASVVRTPSKAEPLTEASRRASTLCPSVTAQV